MSARPVYFETIRQKARQRWDQLDRDPELAGPWHQLFKQVQSPRHILSELLQNADDASATEASVRVDDQLFIFEHNGEDFAEEHFASLCRFGYSNKRALHTIGFRGIGFKSTFSLGDRVELYTPSLSVGFHRRRFTEPEWITTSPTSHGRTRIQVCISDVHRKREVAKNLEDWLKSPVSLLFFKNIRRMRIGDQEVHWGSLGPGPLHDSEWMALHEKADETYLLVRSKEELFPDEALAEIRQERMLGSEDETEFPPSKVEIVLGAPGRLYVVLPTGVETELPFACNAPFIQDPARLKIKDPETSPTNRWLLERAGKLAATAMMQWLAQDKTLPIERARAYGLFPDIDRDDSSLEGVCGAIVEDAFADVITGKDFLLTEEGGLVGAKGSIAIPTQLLQIWAPDQAATLIDPDARPALCQNIVGADVEKMVRWDLVDEVDKQQLLAILQNSHLPKPDTWRQLLALWAYIAPEMTGYRHYALNTINAKNLRILPVQGKDVLYAAGEVVRLGEKKLLQSEDDWDFLAKHLIVLNQNWPRYLAEQRRAAEQTAQSHIEPIEAAYAILDKIGLADTSDVNKVVDQVAAEFYTQQGITLAECIQLAHIAAKLGAIVSDAFCYATRDLRVKPATKSILYDHTGELEDMLPDTQRDSQLLHPDYAKSFKSCTSEDWQKWVASGRSGLLTFVPLVRRNVTVYGKRQIEQLARNRGLKGELAYHYVTNQFIVEDWDFDESYWMHWKGLAAEDESHWVKLVQCILAQRETYWSQAKNARLLQVATTGNTRSITFEPAAPSWIARLRDLPCLRDTRGFNHIPHDLMRRTPETESLIDVEPFVHGLLDRETTRPLLDLLGVRCTPTGPGRLLDRLRALAESERPPMHEVEKWYRRLDQMVDTCSTLDLDKIKLAFQTEKLVLTQDDSWAAAPAVFLRSDEDDVPDAPIVRSAVRDLTLWRKIGIAERPTLDLAITWLQDLPSGIALSQDDVRRVRSLLARHPVRIWEECAHWLNLAGEWVPVAELCYAITMQSLVPWSHLHQGVKQKTADLQRILGEVAGNPPFADVPLLATQIEEHVQDKLHSSEQTTENEWLHAFAAELCRVELDSDSATQRVRALAHTLARTALRQVSKLEIIPYINGTPAGTPRRADVVWLDEHLYVEPISMAKLARRVPEEIGKQFARQDIKAALDYSFERSSADIRQYLEENFTLADNAVVPVTPLNACENLRPTVVDRPGEVDSVRAESATAVHPTVSEDTAAPGSLQNDDLETPEAQQPVGVEVDVVEYAETRTRPVSKAAKPSIIEQFAKTAGFRKDGDDRFYHDNGHWIGKTNGNRFPWERRAPNGDLLRYYWPKEQCLEEEPLQLEADIWALIVQQPEVYALILSNTDGTPVEVTGTRLCAMQEHGKIKIYPATYRLVYEHDRQI